MQKRAAMAGSGPPFFRFSSGQRYHTALLLQNWANWPCLSPTANPLLLCGLLFFSKVKDIIIFGAANFAILLVVMAVKRYAFTSVWCAYAAVASVIILAYSWKSSLHRPFRYDEAM
jgi:hypothetical protein